MQDAAAADWIAALGETHELIDATAAGEDARTRADGLRYATRLASIALSMFVENNDPLLPELSVNTDENHKFGFDNPDNLYRRTPLRDDQDYVLSGRRGSAPYIGLSFGAALFTGETQGPQGTLAQYHLDEFGIGPGDEFGLTLRGTGDSGGTPGTRSIRLPNGTSGMIVRETFFDKTAQAHSDLRIRRVADGASPSREDAASVPEQLADAARFLRTVCPAFVNLAGHLATTPFHFTGTAGRDTMHMHGDPDLYYAPSWWTLDADEAMLVTVEPAERYAYWGFQLADRWLESLDYRYLPVATNNDKAVRNEDGTWTIVVAQENPGVDNWLTTDGLSEGGMCFRWLLASDEPPLPSVEIVKLDSLTELG